MKIKTMVLALMMVPILSSCSVVTATSQPAPKDLSVLHAGTHRDIVLAELGTPITSQQNYDVFRYQPGSSGWKYGRAFFYAATDIITVGLAELIWYPIEKGAATNEDHRIRVYYDDALRVTRHEDLQGGNAEAKK